MMTMQNNKNGSNMYLIWLAARFGITDIRVPVILEYQNIIEIGPIIVFEQRK